MKYGLLSFLLLFIFLISCGDPRGESDYAEHKLDLVKEYNSEYRERMKKLLSLFEKDSGIEVEEEKFVSVIFGEGKGLVLNVPIKREEDISKGNVWYGRDLLLTYLNLPQDSELPSGFYTVAFYEDQAGQWWAEFKDLNGTVIYRKEAKITEHEPSEGVYPTVKVDEHGGFVIIDGCVDPERGLHAQVKVNICIPKSGKTSAKITHGCIPLDIPEPEDSNDSPKDIKGDMVVLSKELYKKMKEMKIVENSLLKGMMVVSAEDVFFINHISVPEKEVNDVNMYMLVGEIDSDSLEEGIYKLELIKEGERYKGVLKDEEGNIVKNADIWIEGEIPQEAKKIRLNAGRGRGYVEGSVCWGEDPEICIVVRIYF